MHRVRKVLLVVDDDRNFCLAIRDYLASSDLAVHVAHTGEDGLALCARNLVDVVLLDQKLPDAEGPDLCPAILERCAHAKIIFTTAFPSFENAVKAVRNGASDYLAKPIELEELDLAVKQALRTLDLEKVEQFQNYRSEQEREESVLVGDSSAIVEIRRLIDLAADADAPVLVTGETGSGKSAAARAIHYRGTFRKAPFVSINCAAVPETLIEAELFGYEKGAFTGANALKKGMFEMAEGGTLFLDELGEMPLSVQTKLLGVLDDGTFRRLGGTTVHQAQVRVIAATSVDLERAIQQREFRRDLYYRLGVVKILLPPLRHRKEDLEGLCAFLLRKAAKGKEVRLAAGEVDKLSRYDWPGNVRELRNLLERAVILQRGIELRPSAFLTPAPPAAIQRRALARTEPPSRTLDAVEKEHILAALHEHAGNYSRAARAIGISLSTFKRRLKRYNSSDP
jgi:DNA-binding NtrC family response regulator